MTIEQRLDQLEQQNQRIERKNKPLTVALTMTVVAMAAVVTMAATGLKDGNFDTVRARHIWVTNDTGETVVSLSANDAGDGLIYTQSAKGNDLVQLGATVNGKGTVTIYQPNGKKVVFMKGTEDLLGHGPQQHALEAVFVWQTLKALKGLRRWIF